MGNYLSHVRADDHLVSTPHQAAFNLAANYEARIDIQVANWTVTGTHTILSHYSFNQGQYLALENSFIRLWAKYVEGSAGLNVAVTGLTNNTRYQLRCTLTLDNGANSVWLVQYRTDGNIVASSGWTTLGSASAAQKTGFVGPSSQVLAVGNRGDLSPNSKGIAANIRRVLFYDDIGGSPLADFNADDFTVGDSDGATAEDDTGNTWTIHGLGSVIVGPTPSASTRAIRSPRYGLTRMTQ